MPIEHKNITEANLHELKGASTAVISSNPVSDGAGSHTWRVIPHGHLYYDNIGTGTTYTTPTAYTLIGPATTGEASYLEMTHNSLGRLTYTGVPTRDFGVLSQVTIKHSTGSGQDCYFQIHKNGSAVAGAQLVLSADSGNYHTATITCHVDTVATNDYFELFCKVATGNIIVHAFTLNCKGQR